MASWRSEGQWHNRSRSVNAYGFEGALMQCLRLLEETDYLDMPIEETENGTASP